jgi:hypothetical protein
VIVAVGYGDNDFDMVILKTYTPDGTFTKQVSTYTFTRPASNPVWVHLHDNAANDSLGIASILGNILSDISNRHSKILDFEIYVPTNRRTYQFSKLTFAGPETEKVKCYHGSDPEGSHCTNMQYINSYVLDGTVINFPSNTNFGYISFKK